MQRPNRAGDRGVALKAASEYRNQKSNTKEEKDLKASRARISARQRNVTARVNKKNSRQGHRGHSMR